MSSLSRLHWHNKHVELHFGFKSSSKRQIQSPMMKESFCPRPSIKLSLLSDKSQMPASCSSFSLSSSAPHFSSSSSYFYLHRGSYHQYYRAMRQQKMYKVHVKSLGTELVQAKNMKSSVDLTTISRSILRLTVIATRGTIQASQDILMCIITSKCQESPSAILTIPPFN